MVESSAILDSLAKEGLSERSYLSRSLNEVKEQATWASGERTL